MSTTENTAQIWTREEHARKHIAHKLEWSQVLQPGMVARW